MSHVLVVGGGFSGCVVANELSKSGCQVTIVEKSCRIGGKVREYGCKATDKCNNCGVCLSGGLWEKVEKNPLIHVLTETTLSDVTGEKGDFSIVLKSKDGYKCVNGISSIVMAIGFEQNTSAHLQIDDNEGIITGIELEKIMKDRTENSLLEKKPENVAFIQCFGSRDKKEHALYCSRVCCGYSTRAAKVIRQYYPESSVAFFYMELQEVAGGNYFHELTGDNMEFIKCRPLKIKGGTPATITYEDPKTGKMIDRTFDYIVLTEGIHPTKDADLMAELCKFNQDKNGFLKTVDARDGKYVVGCVHSPAKIAEVYADSIAVAKQIVNL